MPIPILSSERAHTQKYGSPRECYKKQLRRDRSKPQKMQQLLTGEDCGLDLEVLQWRVSKWHYLSEFFPFEESNIILDLGSTGIMDDLLLELHPHIQKIVAVDGDRNAIDTYRPYLDSRIETICHNFYDGMPTLGYEFDTVLQIDFPEHLPDKLWIDITNWAVSHLKPNGRVFVFTPEFPCAGDQFPHISVRSRGYYVKVFRDKLGMKTRSIVEDKRVYLIAEASDE